MTTFGVLFLLETMLVETSFEALVLAAPDMFFDWTLMEEREACCWSGWVVCCVSHKYQVNAQRIFCSCGVFSLV